MSGQDSVTSKELVSELRKCGMEGDRYYNRLCAWAAERIQDLQQFHDWAEPQITDLNRTAHEPCDALLEHGTASDEAIVLLLRYRDLLGQCDCDPRDVDRECNYCRTVSLLAHLGVAEYAEHPDYRASGASPPPSNEVIAAAARVANEIELHDDDDPFRDDLRLLVATVRASQPPSALRFPRQESRAEFDWTISSAFLKQLKDAVHAIPEHYDIDMEQIEEVLIALEKVWPVGSVPTKEPNLGMCRAKSNGICDWVACPSKPPKYICPLPHAALGEKSGD